MKSGRGPEGRWGIWLDLAGRAGFLLGFVNRKGKAWYGGGGGVRWKRGSVSSTWAVVAVLIVLAFYVGSRPPFLRSKSYSGTLAGSIMGAVGILVGNQLGRREAARDEAEKLATRQRQLNVLLVAELVSILTKHGARTKSMRLLCTMISEGRADPSTNECWDYLPDEMAVYQAVLPETLILDEQTSDALASLFGGLARTKNILVEMIRRESRLSMIDCERIAQNMGVDCRIGAKFVRLAAPNRKLEFPGKQPVLFSDWLEECAVEGLGEEATATPTTPASESAPDAV